MIAGKERQPLVPNANHTTPTPDPRPPSGSRLESLLILAEAVLSLSLVNVHASICTSSVHVSMHIRVL